jgi:serum/glucocorticoid-regulated kinase 2
LSYIRHPYIVSLHYAFQTPKHLVLVLQFCPGGDLQKRINEEKRINEPRSRLYSAEVLTAVVHLHERLIIYRDLKPENVLLDNDGHCSLCDFGLSKEHVANDTKSFCGSLAFLAPEIIQNKGHNQTVDIYGLGVLIYSLLTGRPPFYDKSKEKLLCNIQCEPLTWPSYVSKSARLLMEGLMNRNPRNRLGAARTADIQLHEFYASMDFEALLRREVPVPSSSSSSRGNHLTVTTNAPSRGTRPNTTRPTEGGAPISNPFACANGREVPSKCHRFGATVFRAVLRGPCGRSVRNESHTSSSINASQCRIGGWEYVDSATIMN